MILHDISKNHFSLLFISKTEEVKNIDILSHICKSCLLCNGSRYFFIDTNVFHNMMFFLKIRDWMSQSKVVCLRRKTTTKDINFEL